LRPSAASRPASTSTNCHSGTTVLQISTITVRAQQAGHLAHLRHLAELSARQAAYQAQQAAYQTQQAAYQAPVQTQQAAYQAPVQTQQPAYQGGSGFQACVIARESGGDPAAVNPVSGAGGLYGFLPSTWQSLGYSGLPEDASVERSFPEGVCSSRHQPVGPFGRVLRRCVRQ
jgi:hypothetical protein